MKYAICSECSIEVGRDLYRFPYQFTDNGGQIDVKELSEASEALGLRLDGDELAKTIRVDIHRMF
jgi:hypothetical protein